MKQAAELKEHVLAAVRRSPSPVRGAVRREALGVLLAGLAVAVALFFAAGGVHHALGRPAWFLGASSALWAAVALLALRAAWRGGIAFGAGSLRSLAVVVVGAPAVLLLASLAFAEVAPALLTVERSDDAPLELPTVTVERSDDAPRGIHRLHAGPDLPCFALTLGAAAFPLIGLSRVRRSSDPMHPVASGAALAVACGALAGVMVDLWCPVAAPRHVLVGHILPIGLLAAAGAAVGARVIAMRPRHRFSA